MQSLFDLNSRFVQLLTRLGQLILLNFCFLLCSLPLVTLGTAATALYTVCFRLGTPREGHVVADFFRSFWGNLKQGTAIWLVLLPLLLLVCWCVFYCLVSDGILHYAFAPFLVLLVLVLIVCCYAFPLMALFENTPWRTLKNAAILGIGNLPRSLGAVAVLAFPLVLFLVSPNLLIRAGIFLLFLYASAAAWAISWILRPVFAPFLEEETEV